jgi:CheY-like chemotaxis protein
MDCIKAANSLRLRGTVVLAIDDDQDSRSILKTILHQAGASVVEAASGAEGLKIFPAVHPNVVLCDLRMPEIDGYQVLKRIRALESNQQDFSSGDCRNGVSPPGRLCGNSPPRF